MPPAPIPKPRTVLRTIKRAMLPLGLRLGSFDHYPPRPLAVPPRYTAAPTDNGPAIDIVTPSFQQAPFLERTIQSVLDQGYPRLRYVIQDGGSTDGSADIIRRYAHQLHAWASEPDDGQADAIRRGFERTAGAPDDVMAWLNSDDLLLPGALHAVAACFRERPEVDVVYGHRVVVDPDGREVGRWVLPGHRRGALIWRDYIPQETMFWRRRLWDRVGGIDPGFQFAMDWDLVARFDAAGARFLRLPRFLAAFTTHPDQKSLAVRETVGEAEFARIRDRLAPTAWSRLRFRVASASYLLHSIGYHWAYRTGLARY